MNYQITAPPVVVGSLAMPTSKSMSNRALLIDALCPQQVYHLAHCDDTAAMVAGLQPMSDVVNVGAAGTAMRFLTAYYANRPGRRVTLDGDARMRQRPIAPLVEALQQMGACITYVDKQGFPPLLIDGRVLRGGTVRMSAVVSSQFVSAVMMLLPMVGGGVVQLEGDVVSRPYIDMTAEMMRRCGAQVTIADNYIEVAAQPYLSGDVMIEGDWSAAACWYSLVALLPGSRLTLRGLERDSVQGDRCLADLATRLGVHTHWLPDGVLIESASTMTCCCSFYADMSDMPDLVPSLVVLLCLLERAFRLTGLRSLRVKESDRVEVLRSELLQLGYVLQVEAGGDAVSWYGQRVPATQHPIIDPHDDHRIAMAFVPAAARCEGLAIAHPQVVEKSYPEFWRHLASIGFSLRF